MKIKMNIDEEILNYTKYMTAERLREKIYEPLRSVSGEFKGVIPSVMMDSDGPVLKALFIFIEDYIVEVDMLSKGDNFDISRFSFFNLRIKISSTLVKGGDGSENEFWIFDVFVKHSSSMQIGSQMHYVSESRSTEWLDKVKMFFSAEKLGNLS